MLSYYYYYYYLILCGIIVPQTYTMRSTTLDYTGAYISSDGPIAVYSGHECADVPVGVGFCNHIVVGVPPVASLGTTFYGKNLQAK